MGQSRDSKQLLDFLMKGYNFKPEMIDVCYNFAKFQYECGNYSGASEYLYFHRILVQPTDKNYLNGMWGKLAAEILMQNRDTALEDLNRSGISVTVSFSSVYYNQYLFCRLK